MHLWNIVADMRRQNIREKYLKLIWVWKRIRIIIKCSFPLLLSFPFNFWNHYLKSLVINIRCTNTIQCEETNEMSTIFNSHLSKTLFAHKKPFIKTHIIILQNMKTIYILLNKTYINTIVNLCWHLKLYFCCIYV